MSTKFHVCYTVICDGCEATYDLDYEPHFPSKEEAIGEVVANAEWWGDESLLLCHDCRHRPHAFIPSTFYDEECDRCPNPADEHDIRSAIAPAQPEGAQPA